MRNLAIIAILLSLVSPALVFAQAGVRVGVIGGGGGGGGAPLSPPTFVGRSQGINNAAPASVAISTPAGIQTNDLMLVWVITFGPGLHGVAPLGSPPAGFTQVGSWKQDTNNGQADNDDWIGLFSGVYSGTTSFTFGSPGNYGFPKAVMRVYRGATSTVDGSNNAGSTSSAQFTLQIPALSATGAANEMYAALWAYSGSGAPAYYDSVPGDLIHTTEDDAEWKTFEGDKVIASFGTNPGAKTAGNAGSGAAARLVAWAVTLVPSS